MAFYYSRRLASRRSKPERSKDSLSESSAPRHYDVWREGAGAVWAEYEELPEERVFKQLETIPANRFILILGEPGAGKTSLIENWFVQLATKVAQQKHLGITVPILIHFRQVPPATWQINNEHKFVDALWNSATVEKALVS
jgi:Cdc6-like AAA superfamily ATPase